MPDVPLVYFGRLFLTVLPTLLALFLLRRFLLAYVSPGVADGVVATYALGTLAFSYSLLFMSHQTTAVLLVGSFYALWRCARGEWRDRGYVVAGAFAGATVAAEYTGALAVLGLVAYAVVTVLQRPEATAALRWSRLGKAAGLATLGALPFVLGLMAYHQAAFGHPLESGYKHLNDAAYQPWHLGGFLGIRYPDPRAFALSFFSPLRGLFVLAPFLLVALPGLVLLWRRSAGRPPSPAGFLAPERSLFWLSTALLVGYAYFTSSFSYDSWGWTTGPRHMTGMIPFLLLPIALVAEWARSGQDTGRRVVRGVVAGACAASVLITGALSFVNYFPDDVSSPLFAMVLPLFREGFLVPSALNALGIANPVAGTVLTIALCVSAGLVVLVLCSPESAPVQQPSLPASLPLALITAVVVTAGIFGVHAGLARHTPQDGGAIAFLKAVWLVRPGESISFWPTNR